MIVHNFAQGSAEWLAHRATHFNASEAAAMLGLDPHMTRARLLRQKHTTVAADPSSFTERVYDAGHRSESLARPLAEEIIGEDMAPLCGSLGNLSASFDGINLAGTIVFEHKAMNDELKACVVDEEGAGQRLPIHHRVQMEQQLLVSGARQALFMASKWAEDGTLLEERHCWYYPDPDLRQRIIDGWAQFERDLATYTLPESEPAEQTGRAPETLPALRIELVGQVTASNLAEFKETALTAIRSVNRDLKTDQDFADASKALKWCSDVEDRLKAAKQHALSQTATIDQLFRTIDDISSEARRVRLDLDKLVTRRKTEIKEAAVLRAFRAFDDHVAELNAEIAPMRVQVQRPDFAGVIKGLSSIDSINDKLDMALLNAKITADASAKRIRENIASFNATAAGFEFLFADLGQIVSMDAVPFRAIVENRITAHKADEARKEAARKAEEERRIAAAEQRAREQEASRIAEEQRQKQEAEERGRQMAEAAEQKRADEQRAEQERQEAAALQQRQIASMNVLKGLDLSREVRSSHDPEDSPLSIQEPANMNIGDISRRLGFIVSSELISETLKVPADARNKRAMLYTESSFRLICSRLIDRLSQILSYLK